jgi:NADPH:quinone reductase-like Zn-dependent oxidoreductase
MKAICVHQLGGPDVLSYEDVPRPDPSPGEVLIQVHAAGLNPPDWYGRGAPNLIPESMRPKRAFPFTPGSDVSGVAAAVGPGVTEFKEGDAVFGLVRFPDFINGGKAYAEFTTAPAAHLARKPQNIDHIQAAAIPMSGLTAWQYLFEHGADPVREAAMKWPPWDLGKRAPVPLGSGKTVLVNGAAGGVGHFAVQLAKLTQARVVAVASGRHAAFLRDLGVDEFLDYTKGAVEEAVTNVDVVIDTVGGPLGYRFLRVLKPGGTLCPVFLGEYHRDEAAKLDIRTQSGQVHSDGSQLADIARLVELGKLRVGIDSVFPLADARVAHARAEMGHIQGKIVLNVAGAASPPPLR